MFISIHGTLPHQAMFWVSTVLKSAGLEHSIIAPTVQISDCDYTVRVSDSDLQGPTLQKSTAWEATDTDTENCDDESSHRLSDASHVLSLTPSEKSVTPN